MGIYLSTNSGSTLIAVDSGLTNTSVSCLAISGSSLFAGTFGGGVFLSTNSGTSWTSVNSGWTSTNVSCLNISGKDLIAGTNQGVWRRPLSEMLTSVQSSSTVLPTHFNLAQNYPNPFNPSTTIRYSLPRRSQVLLSVYNTLGQLVATPVQAQQEAGSYEVKFDGSGLASGVYFYRLQTGRFVDTKKLLLLK